MYRLLALTLTLPLIVSGCALLRSGPPKPEPAFVDIPGGTFQMGAPNDVDSYALPVHPVTVEPFEMMAREVTFAEFDRFADAHDTVARPDSGDFGRGPRAVVQVTWDEAAAFCDWIDARLPSEREWEWAARGATAAQRYGGTDSLDDLARYAWYHETEPLFTTTAARRAPNPLGLYDITGNAYEWIGAFYQTYPEPGTEPEWYPLDDPAYDLRMVRGGSFRSPEAQLPIYTRASTLQDVRSETIGIRCVR